MLSRHKCLLVEVEVAEDKTPKEEEEAHREVEETSLQAQVEGAAIRIKVKAQANTKHKEKGMINPKSNVIIVRNMGTMSIYVEKNKMT